MTKAACGRPQRGVAVKGPVGAGWCDSTRAALAALALTLSACGGDAPSLLEPASEAARLVERLWWLLFWISAVVVVVVAGFIAAATLRPPAAAEEVDRRMVPWGEPFVVVAGLVVSGLVLAGTFVVSVIDLNALGSPPGEPQLEIEVVARTWWWEVRYPNGAVTANEIHVPVGVPVEVALPTGDVIHSFWVPQLQVKKDHVPGVVNRLWLQADEPGRYRGQCAEYCGLQHANMVFYVVADPPDDFQAWVIEQAARAAEPTGPGAQRGRDVFLGSSCVSCHTIRGTPARGELGPDLTHLASREKIAAGLFPLLARTCATSSTTRRTTSSA
ncbi:MAG: cytochrome c oxidase subunit II [Nitriliruptorales bacterium]|nr:cytochrome c oxidase subunit II [Nitriliruptorales bacterium]